MPSIMNGRAGCRKDTIMMASSKSGKPSKSLESLLDKLKKGQKVLKKSIENIKSNETVSDSQKMLGKRRGNHHYRNFLTVNFDTANLPTKRARLLQLTPEHEVF